MQKDFRATILYNRQYERVANRKLYKSVPRKHVFNVPRPTCKIFANSCWLLQVL